MTPRSALHAVLLELGPERALADAVFPVKLPPLHERADDVDALARAFLADLGRELGRPALRLAPEASALLRSYPWPGNVRELRNVMERAAVLANDDVIDALFIRSLLPGNAGARNAAPTLDRALDELGHANISRIARIR